MTSHSLGAESVAYGNVWTPMLLRAHFVDVGCLATAQATSTKYLSVTPLL